MPLPSTMTPIATQTLTSAAASVTFSSIPQGYTDLYLVFQCGVSSGTSYSIVRANGDSDGGNLYGNTYLGGAGAGASSGRNGGLSGFYTSYLTVCNTTLDFIATVNIMNYSNSTTYKTALSRGNIASGGTEVVVSCRRVDTNSITSLNIKPTGGVNYISGSTFTLYGIKAAS